MGACVSKKRVDNYSPEKDFMLQFSHPVSSTTIVRDALAKFSDQLSTKDEQHLPKAIVIEGEPLTPGQIKPLSPDPLEPPIIAWLYGAFDNLTDQYEKNAVDNVIKSITKALFEKDLLALVQGNRGRDDEFFNLVRNAVEDHKLTKRKSQDIEVFRLVENTPKPDTSERTQRHFAGHTFHRPFLNGTTHTPFPFPVDYLKDTLILDGTNLNKQVSYTDKGQMKYFIALSFNNTVVEEQVFLEKIYSDFTVLHVKISKPIDTKPVTDKSNSTNTFKFTITSMDRNQNRVPIEVEPRDLTPSEVYAQITRALFDSLMRRSEASQNEDKTKLKMEALSLSLRWDLDVSEEYKRGSDLRSQLLDYIFRQAVRFDRVKVVESIMTSDDFNIEKSIDFTQLSKQKPPSILKKITMQVIKRKYFKPFIKRVNTLLDNRQANSQNQKEQKINEQDNSQNQKEQKNNADVEEKSMLTIQGLFLYALTSNKFEMSKIFFAEMEHPTAAALVAVGVFDKQLKGLRVPEWQAKLQIYIDFYKKMSHDIINQLHSTTKEGTYEILVQKLPAWNSKNLIDIAVNTANGDFISQTACDLLNYRIWKFGCASKTEWKEFHKGGKEQFGLLDFKKWIKVLLAPYVLFSLNFIGFLVFLLLYSLLLVSKLERHTFHWLEWILWVWIGTFLLEEIVEISITRYRNKEKTRWNILKSHFKDAFNRIDAIAIVLFLVAWTIRCVAKYNSEPVYLMDVSRVIFSIDFIAFSFRLLEHCYGSFFLGPLIVMISDMVTTTIKFLIILSAFFIGFAVASESVLNPEAQMNGWLPFYLFRKPFWNMFGEFFLEDLDASVNDQDNLCTDDPLIYNKYTTLRCPSEVGKYFVPVLMGLYYLTTNTLLFNLLIAKFNYKIADIENSSAKIWRYQYFMINIEYSKMCILPPPFFGLTVLLIIAHVLGYRGDLFSIDIPKEKFEALQRLEKTTLYNIIQSEKEKENICSSCSNMKNSLQKD